MAKIELRGPVPPGCQYIVNYCLRVYSCTQKMLKETGTKETIRFLSHFYHWWHFSWTEVVLLATPMPTTALVFEKLKNNVVTFTQTLLSITHILVVFVIKTFLEWL